jgi:hypothetical protein
MWIFPGGNISLIAVSLLITIVIFVKSRNFKWHNSSAKIAFANFITLYLFIVVSVVLYDFYIEYKLSTFDLDGDGIFSAAESTIEQAIYMNIVTNDAGRNFAPITGAAYSGIYSLLIFAYLNISSLINRNRKK